VGLFDRKHLLSKRSAQGPPPPEEAGTSNAPITWVFEPESFAPLAKLTATERFGIVTDHLGTPTAMLDEQGGTAWSADIGVYGELRNVIGEKQACPFRWPGQYEDEETGLYYNRFRYYDPEAGVFVSQDPIGLMGGHNPHRYVRDPLSYRDPLGLASCGASDEPAKTFEEFQAQMRAKGIRFNNAKDAAAGWRVYKQSSGSAEPLVIGRLPDTKTGDKLGMTRLNDPNWSPNVNDAWMQGGIDARKPFYLGSEPSDANRYNAPGSEHPTTVFHRELGQLENAGYNRTGDYMTPP
jgi:RHS repeat-associated protein